MESTSIHENFGQFEKKFLKNFFGPKFWNFENSIAPKVLNRIQWNFRVILHWSKSNFPENLKSIAENLKKLYTYYTKPFFCHNFQKNRPTEPRKILSETRVIHLIFLKRKSFYPEKFGSKQKSKFKKKNFIKKMKCPELLQTLKQGRGLVGAYYTITFLQNS